MIILTNDLRSIDLTGKELSVDLTEIRFSGGEGHHEKPLHVGCNKKAIAMMALITTARDRGDEILDLTLLDAQ